jgi:hypothetical protein
MHVKTWHVDVFVSEDDDATYARAVLSGDRPGVMAGTGMTRRNPRDPAVPEIGDEVAVARALGSLSAQLMHVAEADIQASAEDSFRAG